MRFLISIAGVTLLDHKRSEGIRKDLNIFRLTGRLYLNINRWKQRLERMGDNRITKKI